MVRVVGASIGVAALLGASACSTSSDGPEAVGPARSTTTSASDIVPPNSGVDPGGATTTEPGATTTTTSPFGDTIDVSGAPPVLFTNAEALYLFEDLSEPAEVRVGPLEQTESFLLSPDGAVAAVGRAGDAVRDARVELISMETGEALQTFEVDSDTLRVERWSPDSQVALVRGETGLFTYRLDGETKEVTGSRDTYDVWATGESGTVALTCEDCSGVQAIGASGTPVAIAVSGRGDTVVAGTFDVDAGKIVPFDGVWGSAPAYARLRCTGFVPMSAQIGDVEENALYDVDGGRVIQVEGEMRSETCPVTANDGSKAAMAMQDGSVVVVDSASGETTQVARQGSPMAWSADDSTVVVNGNGTYLVAADGSGGGEASIDIQSACPLDEPGTALVAVAGSPGVSTAELALYDIDADSAVTLGALAMGAGCEVSEDGGWALTDDLLIDLEELVATRLDRQDADGRSINSEKRFLAPASRAERLLPA